MSKELEALERIRRKLSAHYDVDKIFEWSIVDDDFNDIEKELKRLEEIDNSAFVCIHVNRYDELEKKERALEIIKDMFDYDADINEILRDIYESENYEDFAFDYSDFPKEQYDSLKEVLL